MVTLKARDLHNETSAILDQLEKGERFRVQRNGRLVALLEPVVAKTETSWDEIMTEVWAAQKQAGPKTKNPVLAERTRRRR
jgi:antitoxin (DNA-binding transcriptional repressor) of toxin-antitoxin stability system